MRNSGPRKKVALIIINCPSLIVSTLNSLGVISQSVKDVVQSLVDDGLVDTDKIGTSVYFWAFPSKALQVTSLVDISLDVYHGCHFRCRPRRN